LKNVAQPPPAENATGEGACATPTRPLAQALSGESSFFNGLLDDVSLDIVMGEVDTITDFVSYLSRKERFLQSGKDIFAAGEEDLLALYLRDVNLHGEHDSQVPDDAQMVVLEEGQWEAFRESPQYMRKLQVDGISYAWDRLIEEFAKHAFGDTQYHTSHRGVYYSEKIMRFLAREPRLKRR